MTITELQILLSLHTGNEIAILNEHASQTRHGYFFVDSKDGQCYLFGKNGKMNDIKKMKTLDNEDVKKDIKKDIKKIVIPDSVKNIGGMTFYDCTSFAVNKLLDF